MNTRLLPLLALAFLAAAPSPSAAEESPAAARPNILFISVDDLNHWVGHLGRHPQALTPNLDRLAAGGVSFASAYCTAPACNPSRASLMSGLRPTSTGAYLNEHDWRPHLDPGILLNTRFLRAGYRVYGAGKIYHGAYGEDADGAWTDYRDVRGGGLRLHPSAPDDGVGGIKFGPLANGDEDMPDYRAASYCIERLSEEHDGPFFIACGLFKPHMPFSVPKKWFDLFPLESVELPPHREDDLDDVPPAGVRMARTRDHEAILASGRWREAVQAYLATVAFADAQIGRLLDALEVSPHRDNTIVCLWSDHGWSLGEKSHWRKFALWEEPTRSVLIWRVPGLTPEGGLCEHAVDLSSVYPTLCSLAGLEPPAHLDGPDLVPLLTDPSAPWDLPALTTHGRGNHAVRLGPWRYIRYADGGEELYDHREDPLEYANLAASPEHAETKAELAAHLPAEEAPDLPK